MAKGDRSVLRKYSTRRVPALLKPLSRVLLAYKVFSQALRKSSPAGILRDAVSKGQLAITVDTFFAAQKSESAPVQKSAPEKQSPVELGKQMVSDAGKGVVGAVLGFNGIKKVNPREEQIRRDVNRALGALSPEQKEAEVQRRLGQ